MIRTSVRLLFKTLSIGIVPLVIGQLVLAPITTAAGIPPGVKYVMDGICGYGAGPCAAHYTSRRYLNPSRYYIRAWEVCTDYQKLYGAWQPSNVTSNTGSCGPYAYATRSGFQYSEAHHYSLQCWVFPQYTQGRC